MWLLHLSLGAIVGLRHLTLALPRTSTDIVSLTRFKYYSRVQRRMVLKGQYVRIFEINSPDLVHAVDAIHDIR